MNINIQVRVIENDEDQYSTGLPFKWDMRQHVGDYDFATSNNIERIYTTPKKEEHILWRPKDFQKARDWVYVNIPAEGNRNRLLKVLYDLEAYPNYWLHNSWC